MRTRNGRNRPYPDRHGNRSLPQPGHRLPDPLALATFYGALLDWPVEASDDWAHIRAEYGDSIGFQKVDGYTPPDWPGQAMPQQMHVDVTVGTTFRVFLDPAGHPFCLCTT